MHDLVRHIVRVGAHVLETQLGREEAGLASLCVGTIAGMAGLALLLATESPIGPSAMTPVVRYQPPAAAGVAAAIATPGFGYTVRPTVDGLQDAFARVGYDLDAVRQDAQTVPRLSLASLPRDLPEISDPARRKSVFLQLALPLVLEANRRVAGQRKRLKHVAERIDGGGTLTPELRAWLTDLANRYRVPAERVDRLLRRVDVVPPSLALAQAAAESGWGTSRFALEGNAVFGQWTFGDEKGLIPQDRPEGRRYKVRAFDRLIDSFRAYLLNLNTHPAYRDFRIMREEMRKSGHAPDGYRLAATLEPYSERGVEYVELLQSIIRANELSALDDARLGMIEIGRASGA